MKSTLVVVPCGRRKIWKTNPKAGPTPARDVYEGAPFKVNREYAEKFADRWVILSAKYGFIDPDFVIPEDYNVTFLDPGSAPISVDGLQRQVQEKGLGRFECVVALGSTAYAEKVRRAFSSTDAKVVDPVAGLSLGRAMGEVRRAIDGNRPFGCDS